MEQWLVRNESFLYVYTSFECILYQLTVGLQSEDTLMSNGERDGKGDFIGYPIYQNKDLFDRLITTYQERRRNKRNGEVIKGILLANCKPGRNRLEYYANCREAQEHVLDDVHRVHDVQGKEVQNNGVQCDVLDVQEKGVQVDSQDEKVFCSIGVQTDDILCSCDSFEGMIPYRKPVIQEIHKYQTPKDLIQTQNVHVVESGFVHGVKSSRCKKMRKKKKKKINHKNKRVYSQKSSNVVKPKSVRQNWVPKQQSPSVELNLKSKPKSVGGSFEDVLGLMKNTKNKLYISHSGWYNVQIGDFLIPTKEPRSSKFDSFVEHGTRFVKKVSQILKWIPKRP
ncbi:hypothetical protein Lser_V15G16168 [Lactuca serriola]